jgi:hypothetical protein
MSSREEEEKTYLYFPLDFDVRSATSDKCKGEEAVRENFSDKEVGSEKMKQPTKGGNGEAENV